MVFPHDQVLALALAVLLCVPLGYYLPLAINQFNDANFGNITLLDEPKLVDALRYAQSEGVLLCVHGYKHENYSSLTPEQAKECVQKAINVFHQAGLTPVAFLFPYVWGSQVPAEILSAVNSSLTTSLPASRGNNTRRRFGEYTWNWRNIKSVNDPQYVAQHKAILNDMPTTILLHVYDWNNVTKQFLCNYLMETNETKITIRVDDVEPNTSPETVRDMTVVLNYSCVEREVFAVISAGTWVGGNPTVLGLSTNTIMKFYWIYFLLTALFPFSFFLFWRGTAKLHRRNSCSGALSKKAGLAFLKKWKIFDSIGIRAASSTLPSEPVENQLEGSIGDSHIHLDAENIGALSKPTVSVIIPAYNEEKRIAKCVEAALNQNYRGEIEVIVVSDGSTDRTCEIVSGYPVKLLNVESNKGKANALNLGAKEAKGDVLVYSDGDSFIANDAVSSLIRTLETNKDAAAVAGNVFIDDEGKNNFLKKFQMIEYYTEQEIGRHLQSLKGSVLVCPGPLFAVRRHFAEQVVFSNETVVEDADYTVHLLKHAKVVREPQAKVFTAAPESLGEWFSQRKRWWYGNLQIWKTHKQWARRNPWMILNYLGFVLSLCSLVMLLLLPLFFLTYDNLALALIRSIPYTVAPVLIFSLLVLPLFIRNKKLSAAILPYAIIYFTIKTFVVSYIYLCYLLRKGMHIRFGSRIIKVK